MRNISIVPHGSNKFRQSDSIFNHLIFWRFNHWNMISLRMVTCIAIFNMLLVNLISFSYHCQFSQVYSIQQEYGNARHGFLVWHAVLQFLRNQLHLSLYVCVNKVTWFLDKLLHELAVLIILFKSYFCNTVHTYFLMFRCFYCIFPVVFYYL